MINRFIILCVFPLVAFADYELFHKSDTNIETYIDPTSVKVDTESNQHTVFVYHNNVSNEMSVEINYRVNCEAQLLFHDMKKTYQGLNLTGEPYKVYAELEEYPIPNTMQYQLVGYICSMFD